MKQIFKNSKWAMKLTYVSLFFIIFSFSYAHFQTHPDNFQQTTFSKFSTSLPSISSLITDELSEIVFEEEINENDSHSELFFLAIHSQKSFSFFDQSSAKTCFFSHLYSNHKSPFYDLYCNWRFDLA